jgi:hypothetical protein
MKAQDFKGCLTVKQLKEIIKDWPERDKNGEACEVWIGTGRCLSSPVTSLWPLNERDNDGKTSGDLLLESSAFD